MESEREQSAFDGSPLTRTGPEPPSPPDARSTRIPRLPLQCSRRCSQLRATGPHQSPRDEQRGGDAKAPRTSRKPLPALRPLAARPRFLGSHREHVSEGRRGPRSRLHAVPGVSRLSTERSGETAGSSAAAPPPPPPGRPSPDARLPWAWRAWAALAPGAEATLAALQKRCPGLTHAKGHRGPSAENRSRRHRRQRVVGQQPARGAWRIRFRPCPSGTEQRQFAWPLLGQMRKQGHCASPSGDGSEDWPRPPQRERLL